MSRYQLRGRASIVRRLFYVTFAAGLVLFQFAGLKVSEATPTFDEYTLSSGSDEPSKMTVGPDNAMWYIQQSSTSQLGRITTAGSITDHSVVPSGASDVDVQDLTSGPDGNLWFTACITSGSTYYGAIGKMTTGGTVTYYTYHPSVCRVQEIAAGSDGNIWFTVDVAGTYQKFSKITTSGTITDGMASGSTGSAYRDLVPGPDGKLWAADWGLSKITKVNTTGGLTEYSIPTTSSRPRSLIAGPDGNLWFTESAKDKIGKVTTSGSFTEYSVPSGSGSGSLDLTGIAAGPDGALWFTETNTSANKVGRITTSGSITEYSVPTSGGAPYDIVAGPDDGIWFTEFYGDKIGRLGY
jgi:streptogramin lyase